jgi:AAA+ superfamily predicted ATPase
MGYFDVEAYARARLCTLEKKQGIFNQLTTYEEYGIPWKRGILFVGSPGNGKTHAVKALINSMEQPCLYVKSFR